MISLLLALGLVLLSIPAHAQTVTFCEKGTVCWTDQSKGLAKTDLRIATAEGTTLATVGAGLTKLDLVPIVRSVVSDWVCIQARHVYPDGKVSGWYVSETEGVCKPMSVVIPPPVVPPPIIPPPIVPPPIVPPPVVPPPPPGPTLAEVKALIAAETKARTDALAAERQARVDALKAMKAQILDAIAACIGKKPQQAQNCLVPFQEQP